MTHEYNPDHFGEARDPNRCKAKVASFGWPFRQCQHPVWRDGWCKQHHPDIEAVRKEQQWLEYQRKRKTDPDIRLVKAQEEIERLKARITELEAKA